MDPDMMAALESALDGMSPDQTDEFRRRFARLCENALISNHNDSEVRRVLQLITIDAEGDA
jgi:hypothetical protein